MAQAQVVRHDVGTEFILTLVDQDGSVIDVSVAANVDAKQIRFRKPDGEVFEKDAAYVTDGTDGKITYTVADSDVIDLAGAWRLQAFVHFSTGDQWSSEVFEFQVLEDLV